MVFGIISWISDIAVNQAQTIGENRQISPEWMRKRQNLILMFIEFLFTYFNLPIT